MAPEPTTSRTDTAAVRAGEELNLDVLRAYLRDKIEGAGSLTIEQFPGGHSNLTYLVRTPAREYVLRRGPLGPVAPKAHDMAREYMVLKAVHPFFAAAPEVYHLCEDTSIVGAVFFLMERRRGIVMRDHIPAELAAFPDYQARVSRGFVDCLVELHAIDIEKHGLVSLGKPAGFLERQVRGWFERWNRAKTEEIALMDRLISWLTDHLPVSPAPTLVHNDFKLDNLMLSLTDPGRIEAVLDWEMATVGDPLVDLGLILCYWSQPSDPGGTKASLTSQPGWFTRDELVGRYAEKTGRDLTLLNYYEVFALFKLAVVLQQIYVRFHRGQTQDERFRHFDKRVHNLIQLAAALI
ncbi:MAG TPA: phosphotransferase family protein [Bryobacteraceae bacterium]|nr:phosphotransferase family protein [Bryobacteraceae bacterium]